MSFPGLTPEPFHPPTYAGAIPVSLPAGASRSKLQSAAPAVSPELELWTPFGWNWWLRRAAAGRVSRGSGRNVLIVGAGLLGREMAAILRRDHAASHSVVGFLDGSAPLEGEVLGRIEDLAHIARAKFVDEVILAIPDQYDAARRVIRDAQRNRLSIRMIPDLYDCELGQKPNALVLQYFGGLPVLSLHEEKFAATGLFWKRCLDVGLSAAALLVLAPLLAAIALAIKATSPGLVLYRASRVGLKGKKFFCYKFRTMVANADQLKDGLRQCNERQGPCFKIADDPRITGLGRFLRRYSLDELPQLWNVLRGEMSLVGPRPHPLDDFQQYRLDHLRRLDVTPGITGLWQVTARRDPSFQRNMALDLEYIERWNFWLDLRILWKTVFVVIGGSGA
ncbi:MAG: exopolysaccharide biosynthesis polyprenyl glycosylphosphotransferase [Terriglobales bacterium]